MITMGADDIVSAIGRGLWTITKYAAITAGLGMGVFAGTVYFLDWREERLNESPYPAIVEQQMQPILQEFKEVCEKGEELDKILEKRDDVLESYGCELGWEKWYCYGQSHFGRPGYVDTTRKSLWGSPDCKYVK